MLQITLNGNIVTEDPKSYYSISIGRGEVAHMVDGKIDSYIDGLGKTELQSFIELTTFEKIEEYYNTFTKITY